MRVLVVGSGGREHALVWKIAESPLVEKIWCAPGNGGISRQAEPVDLTADDLEGLAGFATDKKIDLTIAGPEVPLVAGIRDVFDARGLKLVGPSRKAAALEGSKVFAKEFMARHGIPTAEFRVFEGADDAKDYVRGRGEKVVIKADGLAAGKGVIVCSSDEDAEAAIDRIMVGKAFGSAGDRVVIEERLEGREASILALVSGETVVPLMPAMDFKRARDGGAGPNTGGMGSIAPNPVVDKYLVAQVVNQVFLPTCRGLTSEGSPYEGILYVGLMLTSDGCRVLEYNCRFGDPETQAILPLLDSDLLEPLSDVASGNLQSTALRWKAGACVCVVLASAGYPGPVEKGRAITGLGAASKEGAIVFHAGTAREQDGTILTCRGRVLGVSAVGSDLDTAAQKAYRSLERIRFDGMQYRRDIGRSVVQQPGHGS